MKSIIFLSAIAAFFLASCAGPSTKHHKSDTAKVAALYWNRMMGGFRMDSIFRIIKDSTKISEDRIVKTRDTTYYVPYYQQIMDSLKRPLKSKAGGDSLYLLYLPQPPSTLPHLENK